MSPRDTGTGGVLEAMILPALKRGGYAYSVQQTVGTRLGGGRHVVSGGYFLAGTVTITQNGQVEHR